MTVQASYQQGDERSRGRGKQLCAYSAVAIQFLYKIISPFNMTSDTFNDILLLVGDALNMLLSAELNTEYFSLDDKSKYVHKLSSSLHGSLNSTPTERHVYVLEDVFKLLMDEHKYGCLIIKLLAKVFRLILWSL